MAHSKKLSDIIASEKCEVHYINKDNKSRAVTQVIMSQL